MVSAESRKRRSRLQKPVKKLSVIKYDHEADEIKSNTVSVERAPRSRNQVDSREPVKKKKKLSSKKLKEGSGFKSPPGEMRTLNKGSRS